MNMLKADDINFNLCVLSHTHCTTNSSCLRWTC